MQNIVELFKEKGEIYELGYRAHYNTSFSPEKRAERIRTDYKEQLESDIENLKEIGATEEFLTEYVDRYITKLKSWLSAKANCLSSMITGPANFPVARAEKANRTEENRYKEFDEFREKSVKRLKKILKGPVTPLTELKKAKDDLAQREKLQSMMKAANKIIRSNKNVEIQLAELGFTGSQIDTMLNPSQSYERKGFQGWELTNNNANIKRLQGRVAVLQKKADAIESGEGVKETKLEHFNVVENAEADRLQFIFEGKPSEEVRKVMKSNGFRWSPRYTAWQRKLTNNAVWVAKRIIPQLNELFETV